MKKPFRVPVNFFVMAETADQAEELLMNSNYLDDVEMELLDEGDCVHEDFDELKENLSYYIGEAEELTIKEVEQLLEEQNKD